MAIEAGFPKANSTLISELVTVDITEVFKRFRPVFFSETSAKRTPLSQLDIRGGSEAATALA